MSRRFWSLRIVVMLAGVALAYLAATAALASILADRVASAALTLAPYNASALAGTAQALLRDAQSRGNLARARYDAVRALEREPVNVAALRVLGLATSIAGDQDAAGRYFDLATRLSKRDLASHLLSIEQDVSQGDIAGALTNYDEALRTSRAASETLLPVLIDASAEPLVAQRLIPLLRQRPSYFRQYFIQGTDTGTDPASIAQIGTKVLDRSNPDDQDLINRTIMRFSREGDYDDAWQMFSWANPRHESANVINGDFDHPTPFRLFNWEVTQSDSLSAEVAPRGETDSLYLFAYVSRGLAARQLLRLSPGRYELTAKVGDVPEAAIDRPTIGITCATGTSTLLDAVTFPTAGTGAADLRGSFNVGANCRYQSLNLTASAASQDEVRTWIDDVVIRPVR